MPLGRGATSSQRRFAQNLAVNGTGMKHFFFIYFLVFAFWAASSAQPSRQSVETGKVIVKLKPETVPAIETRLRLLNKTSSDTSVVNTGIASFDRINRRFRATNMRRVFPDAGEYEAKHRKYGLHLWYEITIHEGEDPVMVAARYGDDENVQISEPRYKIRSTAMPALPFFPAGIPPDDPGFDKQWNFNNTGQTGGTPGADIRLIDAWERVKTLGIRNNNVIVAVMDGGVYHGHEDLHDNMWVNQAELNGVRNFDDDGNGYVDDIYGFNFVTRRGTITPEDHATHVAGIIAAVTNNGTGVSGISGNSGDGYGIKIMNAQIFDGNRTVSSIAPAFAYAADNGAVIAQNSWGYEKANDYNQSDIAAINYFINEAGRDKNGNPRPGTPMVGGIVIFAAGNDGTDDKWYPAYFNNVLAVAATNHHGQRAWYSNYGSWVDISAPGGEISEEDDTGGIYSTSYRDRDKNYYEYIQGTSMACPHVSGVAALILSVYGSERFTPDLLRSRLLCSATPLDGFDPENVSKMGTGMVNASAALASNVVSGSEITDLKAHIVNAVSCRLNWTVPNSEYGYYSIAYATEHISETNFDDYALMPFSISQEADASRQITIAGLTPETSYYIAIRNFDNCYTTAISNVATFKTPQNQPPEFINGLVADTTLIPFTAPLILDLTKYTFDSEDEKITYTLQTNRDGIVEAAINGSILTIYPQYHGDVMLQITATDPHAAQATTTLGITVEQKYSSDRPNELLVYPNPTTGILWYSYVLNNRSESVSVCIVNSYGQIMFRTPSQKVSAGTHYYNIDLQHWNAGMYFLYFIKNGKVLDTKKVVKQ